MIDKAYRGVQAVTFLGILAAFISSEGLVNGVLLGGLLGGLATLVVSGFMNFCRNILGI